MRIMILEDTCMAAVKKAVAGYPQHSFSLFEEPIGALSCLQDNPPEAGIFDVFMPHVENEHVGKLLEDYLAAVATADQIILKKCYVFDKLKPAVGIHDMLARLKNSAQQPYGAALAFKAAKSGMRFAIFSDLHRHITDRGVGGQFHGWLLFLPFYWEGFLTEEEFISWSWGPHIFTDLFGGGKNNEEGWREVLQHIGT